MQSYIQYEIHQSQFVGGGGEGLALDVIIHLQEQSQFIFNDRLIFLNFE